MPATPIVIKPPASLPAAAATALAAPRGAISASIRRLARLATGAIAVSVEPTPLSPPALWILSSNAA
ncbi:hypothetical protein D3C79_1003570 [compost metagenome]